MKLPITLLATVLLSIGTIACGDMRHAPSDHNSATVTTKPSSTSAIPTTASKVANAKTAGIRKYGHAASASDRQDMTTTVMQYYSAAAAVDGKKGCSLLVSNLARSIVEDYGHGSRGPSYLSSGTTCTAVMDLLFKHSHRQFVAQQAKLKVTHVHVDGDHGVAILTVGNASTRKIPLEREQNSWKLQALFDSPLS